MLNKEPKPAYKRILGNTVKAVFILEAAALAVSYGVWYKLNTSRDFRLYMLKNHNWVLDAYYGLGESFADQRTRQADKTIWEQEGKI